MAQFSFDSIGTEAKQEDGNEALVFGGFSLPLSGVCACNQLF